MSEHDDKRDEGASAKPKRRRGRPPKSAEARAEAPAQPARYVVAKGKALTTRGGLLSEGDEIKPDYVPGGADRLAELAAAGYVEAR
jgi:hypothetical protein